MRFLTPFIFTLLSICAQVPRSTAQLNNASTFSVVKELSDVGPEFFIALDQIKDSPVESGTLLNLRAKLLTGLLKEASERKENTRLVASILTLTLGPFGAHRLYLGTDAIVPIFYTATLGGGLGILPVVDLFHILLTRDLSRFYNNSSVFMWGNPNPITEE